MWFRAAGRALEGIVVKNDQRPIGTHMQVLLDVIGTDLDGAIVRLPCVLWSEAREPSMGDDRDRCAA